MKQQPIIIGAGPAGLAAAYRLSQRGVSSTVFEQDPRYVGGISRTVEHKGYRFDIGGHRFFSKSEEVEAFWSEILEEEMLTRGRLSRIYFHGMFFDYPLKPLDALKKLGLVYSIQCGLSYLKARAFPRKPVASFEDWVVNEFGRKLFDTFFKSYTEKVWGMPCSEISADWAAQRIKGLSMGSLIRNVLFPQKTRSGDKEVIKTLIDQFRYPRFGPGQMWERVQDLLNERGSPVRMGHDVVRIRHANNIATSVTVRTPDGEEQEVACSELLSTMPLRSLLERLDPLPPEDILAAARSLQYRDFLIVALILDNPDLFPDNWIYIHEPSVTVGRIQNFKNWSPDMVPNDTTTCLGMEYFCDRDDALWQKDDQELVAFAGEELAKLNLSQGASVVDGAVVRVPKAYPVYDATYRESVALVAAYLGDQLQNVQLVGRNGMHRYNNQDHAIMTGFLAAENIVAGESLYDLWLVNQDAAYHEEVTRDEIDNSGRLTPKPIPAAELRE